jgi:transcriptional regulator with XRE-family HTH domain
MATHESLPLTRWRLFLAQFAAEFGDGWQSELARRVGVSQSMLSKHLQGEVKSVRLHTIELTCARLGIDRAFFFDASLGDAPSYREHLEGPRRATPAPHVTGQESPHWQRFVRLGLAERLGLSDEQIEWLRAAPFRGGAQSVDDYITAAESIVRADLPEPPGMDDARAAHDPERNRITRRKP